MSDELDLTPYCGKEEERSYLHAPFTRGGFTYATNGHICVRVPRREGMEGAKEAPDASKVFPSPLPPVAPLRISNLPEPDIQPCVECGGSRHAHDCPSCKCACDGCDGTGKYEQHRTMRLRGARFSVVYLRMLAAFPGIGVMVLPDKDTRPKLYFRFDGGDGVLMGQSKDLGEAIDAVEAP